MTAVLPNTVRFEQAGPIEHRLDMGVRAAAKLFGRVEKMSYHDASILDPSEAPVVKAFVKHLQLVFNRNNCPNRPYWFVLTVTYRDAHTGTTQFHIRHGSAWTTERLQQAWEAAQTASAV